MPARLQVGPGKMFMLLVNDYLHGSYSDIKNMVHFIPVIDFVLWLFI